MTRDKYQSCPSFEMSGQNVIDDFIIENQEKVANLTYE